MAVFLGIDPSLAGFAFTLREGERTSVRTLYTKPGDFTCFPARLDYLMREFRAALPARRADARHWLAAIEGVSYGHNVGKSVERHAVHAMTRWLLWGLGIPCLDVPPNTLKMFVTDAGNAEKNLMILKVFQRWGYEAPDDNQADSYALARWAEAWASGGPFTKKLAKQFATIQPTLGR